MKYIKVIIDNVSDHTDTFYTYRCDDDEVKRGSVVKVPFGKGNRLKTAYVFDVRNENMHKIADVLNDSHTIYIFPRGGLFFKSSVKDNIL